jgi:hypothetical protein
MSCLQKIALFVNRAALTAGNMAKLYFVQPVAVVTDPVNLPASRH